MATITERTAQDGTKSYKAEVRLKGYPAQRTTFKRKTDARKWVQDTESAIREGRHFKTTEAKKHVLSEAIERYIADIAPSKFKPNELRIRIPILNWWKSQIGYCRLSDLSAKDFSACRDILVKQGGTKGTPLAAATIKRHFVSIAHVLKICHLEWHWIEQNPLKEGLIELPELPRGVVRFLDDDELARLTKACKTSLNKLLYPAFILSVSTGMRQSETMNLYWREPSTPPSNTAWGVVNLSESCIVLHQTKNGNRRRVPLAGVAFAELQKLSKIQRLDTQLVFPSPTKPSKPIELKKAWTTALKKAEIENFRWHDLRHTAASYLAQDGAQLLDIAAVLGHSTLQMVQRYAHLSDNHISATVEKMNQRIGGV
ncbi:MAG: site-specific integrase [Methylococcales bacterium]